VVVPAFRYTQNAKVFHFQKSLYRLQSKDYERCATSNGEAHSSADVKVDGNLQEIIKVDDARQLKGPPMLHPARSSKLDKVKIGSGNCKNRPWRAHQK